MNALNSVLPIFFIILFGLVLKKKVIESDDFWKQTDRLIYYVFFPSLLVSKLSVAHFNLSTIGVALFALIGASLLIGLILIVTHRIKPYNNSLFTSVFQGSIRLNTYIYIAMALSLYGDAGLDLSIVLVGFMILFLNLTCVSVLSIYGLKKVHLSAIAKALAMNPLIISVLVGTLIGIFEIPLPIIILNTIDAIALATLPLSLITVGAGLKLAIGKNRWLAVCIASSLKLILLPLLSFWLLSVFGVSGLLMSVAVLYATIPCASSAYILARQMGGDSEAMASIITVTTLASIITMPFVLTLTNSMPL